MYNKEKVIKEIGEHNWGAFYDWVMSREVQFDEDMLEELFYVGDIADFKDSMAYNHTPG